jgi:serine/threonine-protein kinase
VSGERIDSASDVTQREFVSGQRLFGRFTLIRILGRGGMGIVWQARDEELEREVALKFFPDLIIRDSAAVSELRRETKRCLELTHAHIVRVYDFVHDERSGCISMEYIDGETLASLRCQKEQKVFEPFELSVWVGQLCDALHYAHHRARIIHRDLKPANVMVNRRGNLKVSDFGIARSLGDSLNRLTMEQQGRSGTLVYMSPQQLAGERGSHLDDIYSMGASFYELLTSKPPFYSGNIDRQIHERVAPSMTERRKEFNIEPASVPAIWEEVVAACLQKDPAKRPQSAIELAHRLQLSAPPTPARIVRRPVPSKAILWAGAALLICLVGFGAWYFAKSKAHTKAAAVGTNTLTQTVANTEKSIAVLPFENLSNDKENAYFADGIQDEILTRLSKIADLKVISRTSTQHYKSAPENLPEIARQLGVAHILEGRVQKSGDAVRVNVQLIKATNDSHVWADTFDRKLTDIFSVESEVAKAIADQLRAKLTGREEQVIAAKPTDNPEAYDAYLLGRFELNKFTEDGFTKSLAHFQQAIALDPKFALAYASLADAYNTIGYWGYVAPKEAFPEAKRAAEKALALDPDSAEAHSALAYTQFQYEWKFKEAETEFKEAIRLNPNSVSARLRLFEFLSDFQRTQEAQEQLERARELDPLSIEIAFFFAAESFFARDFDRAIEQLQKTISMEPNNAWAYHLLGAVFYQKKMSAQAFTAHEKANSLEGIFSDPEMADMRSTYEGAGLSAYFRKENEFRQKRLAEGKYQSPLKIAMNYAFAGDDSETLDWLERAVAEHTPWLPELKIDPMWDAVRSQPRFVAVLKKIGLEQ